MSKKSATTKQQPFPKHRPEIKIEDTGAKPFEVDNREVRWWFIVPEIGERVRWAVYEAPVGIWAMLLRCKLCVRCRSTARRGLK